MHDVIYLTENTWRRYNKCHGATFMTHGDDRRLDFLKLYFQVSRQRYTSLNIFIQGIRRDLTVTLDRGYLLSGYRVLYKEREYNVLTKNMFHMTTGDLHNKAQ